MATKTRHDKYDRLFQLIDADQDGVVKFSDGDALARRLLTTYGHQPNSPKARRLQESFASAWQNLTKMDANSDGEVTREEFRDSLSQVNDATSLEQMIRPVAEAEFDAADLDDDGVLSATEITQMWKVWGLSPQEATAAMNYMDKDQDGQVSRDEYLAVWRDYLTSDDPNSPASRIIERHR